MDFAPALLVLAFMASGEMETADLPMAYRVCREAALAINTTLADGKAPGPVIELADGSAVPILEAVCLPVCQDLPLAELALLGEASHD